jgi:hypothetical protein
MTTTIDLTPYCISQEKYDNPLHQFLLNVINYDMQYLWREDISLQFTMNTDKILTDNRGNKIWVCKFTTTTGKSYYFKFGQFITDNGHTRFGIYLPDSNSREFMRFYGILTGLDIASSNYNYVLK